MRICERRSARWTSATWEGAASSANGSVTGTNINGTATINATFGTVTLRNVARERAIVNANGAIALHDVRGAAELSTRFGRVDALGVKGGLQCRRQTAQ